MKRTKNEVFITPLVCAGCLLGLCCRQGLSSRQQLYSSLGLSRINPVAQQARKQNVVFLQGLRSVLLKTVLPLYISQ